MRSNKEKTNRGYALYTAIILTGVLILVAYMTANLASKELILSSSGTDSHIAFYNADSGVECALYADLKNGSVSTFDPSTPGTVSCNGQTITTGSQTVQTVPSQQSVVGGASTSVFQLNLASGCAIVTVTKSGGTTFIQSRGYNSCTGANRLERGVEIQY